MHDQVVAQQSVGLAKALQQVVGGVAQQSFETMQVMHHHQQRILQLCHRHH
ncbi:hypothetical protein D3C81_2325120 [compost metagenome]